ncbi:MAG: adenylyltransferase/cytidyltransferase family protein [Acidimicrobiia bacterium]|nr:adenylyltransferase/cytidyltransferase family protein [Acidimicrobiia bacterium]
MEQYEAEVGGPVRHAVHAHASATDGRTPGRRNDVNEIIGYTTGVFDMFHIGHLNVLRRASERCDRLVVGVTTDELCVARKGKSPVIPFEERREIVASVRYVSSVVAQSSMDKVGAWHLHRFDRMFVGDDWHGSDQWHRYEREFGDLGVELLYLPYTVHTSSTLLRQRVVSEEAVS